MQNIGIGASLSLTDPKEEMERSHLQEIVDDM